MISPTNPLAKLSPDDPTTVEVFECCINGQEISPGYTEQNDPIAQRTTLEHQAGGSVLRGAPVLGRSNAARPAAVVFFKRATTIHAAAPGTGAPHAAPNTACPRRAASASALTASA